MRMRTMHLVRMKHILVLLFLFPVLAPALTAQEREHTCRILFLNGPQRAASKYFLFDGQRSQEVKLPRLSLSPIYKLRSGNIKLWLLTTPIADIEELPKGAPSVVVPEGTQDFYLLMARDPSNSVVPLRMQVVNANYDRIRRGDMLWFNLTSKYLVGKLGSSPLKLPPKKSAMVKAPIRENGNYPVEIYFRVPNDERTHPLIESQWRQDPRSRYIVFVFDEGKRRAPRIQSFTDFRMPEKKEGE